MEITNGQLHTRFLVFFLQKFRQHPLRNNLCLAWDIKRLACPCLLCNLDLQRTSLNWWVRRRFQSFDEIVRRLKVRFRHPKALRITSEIA